MTWASFTQRYEEFGGGGEIPGISWRPEDTPGYVGTGEVDAIDGFLIVLSPWAVRDLSFDEQLARRHGYDVDICLQARAAGRKVVTADLRVVHHHSLDLLADPDALVQAHVGARREVGGPARRRRRQTATGAGGRCRAEAEAAAYRLRMGAARAAAKRRPGQADDDLAQLELDLDRAASPARRRGSGGVSLARSEGFGGGTAGRGAGGASASTARTT